MPARIFAVLVMGASATVANAQTWESQTVFGPGLEACARWTADRKAGKSELAEVWTLGYVAALANVHGPNSVKMDGISPTGIPKEIDVHCEKYPEQDLREATDDFASRHGLLPWPPD